MRKPLPSPLCLLLALSLFAALPVVAAPPVLFVPPPAQQPQTEPLPAGQKAPAATPDAAAAPAPLAAAPPPPAKPAAKAKRLRLSVAPLPTTDVSDTVLVAVQREMGESLRRNPHLDMKDLDVRLAEFAQEMPFEQVELARTTLQEGRDSLFKMELDSAILKISDSVDQLVAVLAYIKKQELAEAMMSLAVAQRQKGKLAPMNQTLRRLLTWRQSYQADDTVPPNMNDPIEAARTAVAKLPQGQLKVTSDPPGSQVFVDGEYIGVAPTVVNSLPIGEHYVTFKKLGFKRGLRVAQVTAAGISVVGKLQRSEKYLLVEQAIARVAPQMGKSPVDPVVDNLRETLFLDHMVFLKASKPTSGNSDELQLRAYLYDLRNRRLLSTQDTKVKLLSGSPMSGSLSGFADAIYSGVDYEGLLQAPVDAPPPPVAEVKPLYKRWWFWTTIGVLVAGAAVGVGVGIATRPHSCPSGDVCTGSLSYSLLSF